MEIGRKLVFFSQLSHSEKEQMQNEVANCVSVLEQPRHNGVWLSLQGGNSCSRSAHQAFHGMKSCKPTVLVGFLFLHKHHDQEASWGGKGLFSSHFHIAVHRQRKSGLEPKQVRKQELMQRSWRDVTYWLASPGLLSLLSYRTQVYHPRDGTTHNGLGLPPLITC